MKRLRLCLALFCFAKMAFSQATTVTPNIGLQQPAFGSPNWQVPLNYDINQIDLMLSGKLPLPGLWVGGPISFTSLNLPTSSVTGALGFTPINPANNGLDFSNAGTTLLNLGGLPLASEISNGDISTVYNFTPQNVTATLTGGTAASVTLNPLPAGVSGADTKHYLYIAGGTGTPEAVLITGGTGNLITFTPANNHSGTWQISSATQGITEAEYALPASGGKVHIPAGSWQLRAAIPFIDNVEFEGDGLSTILLPASCSSVMFDANVPVKNGSEYFLVQDNVKFKNFVLEGAQCAGLNTIYGIRELNSTSSTEVWSLIGMTVEHVYFDNIGNGAFLDRPDKTSFLHMRVYGNTNFTLADSVSPGTPGGNSPTETLFDDLEYTWHPINNNGVYNTSTSGQAVIVCAGCETVYITNSRFSGRPNPSIPIMNFIGGEDFQITNNEFESWCYAIQSSPANFPGGLYYPGYFVVTGNSFDQIGCSFMNITPGTSSAPNLHPDHYIISNNLMTNTNTAITSTPSFLTVPNYATNFSVDGNLFSGISSGGTAVIVGSYVDNIRFGSSNVFTNDYASTNSPTVGLTVSASAFGVYGLENQYFQNFTTGLMDGEAIVNAATTITVPTGRKVVTIGGTTTTPIQTINTCNAFTVPADITLIEGAGASVVKGNNLHLSSNFGPTTTDGSLSLHCNGTYWIETARAVN